MHRGLCSFMCLVVAFAGPAPAEDRGLTEAECLSILLAKHTEWDFRNKLPNGFKQ